MASAGSGDLRTISASRRVSLSGADWFSLKKAQIRERLRRAGISAEQWATLTCPIGIAGIDGKQPAEIAIAVAAQLLQLRHTAAVSVTSPAATTA